MPTVVSCFTTDPLCSRTLPLCTYSQQLSAVRQIRPTCSSSQSNSVLMYSGADNRTGFLALLSAHKYSYCTAQQQSAIREAKASLVQRASECIRLLASYKSVQPESAPWGRLS